MEERLKALLAQPTISIPEAGECLGLSRNGSYEAAKGGYLKTVAAGPRRKRVPSAWLREQLCLDK